MSSGITTSETDPLRIDALTLDSGGRIGMTICPGKRCFFTPAGTLDRDLETDLTAIRDWDTKILISLIEDHEFELAGVPALPELTRRLGMEWRHLPIIDMSIPSTAFETVWLTTGPELHKTLAAGERIVIHCMGGLGRTGTVAARLLIETGMDNETAIRWVRQVRPRTIESSEQERYVRNLKPVIRPQE